MKQGGFSLVELMVVVGLFSILFMTMLAILVNSDTYWNVGQNKITAQAEARRVMGNIVKELRQSNTYWNITIDNANKKILFYKPQFNASGYKTGISYIWFKPNTSDEHIYDKYEQNGTVIPVGYYVENVTFYGSSDNCTTFNTTTIPLDSNCPMIEVNVETKKDKEFNLTSRVTLRNQLVTNETGDLPEEGEF